MELDIIFRIFITSALLLVPAISLSEKAPFDSFIGKIASAACAICTVACYACVIALVWAF